MPPSEVQNYGPQYQGADSRSQQLNFQYSQCTGKKKALCVRPLYILLRSWLVNVVLMLVRRDFRLVSTISDKMVN